MRSGWVFVGWSVVLAGCDKLFSLQHVDYDAPPPCEPLSVSTGKRHTCVVDHAGNVRCWGANYEGEAQPGGPNVVMTPALLALGRPATQVAVGKHHSCALLDDQSVSCWGRSRDNLQATGPTGIGEGPTRIAGLPPVVEISSGGHHVCARGADDGSVWCWGENGYKESGQPTETLDCDLDPGPDEVSPCVPPMPVAGTAGTKALALGHKSSCTITADNLVACWGRNNSSQLGVDGLDDTETPVVLDQVGTVIAIGAAGRSTCAVGTRGSVTCWGDGDNGELGTGAFADPSSPPVGALVQNAREVAMANFGACALRDDGSVWCWGDHDGAEGEFSTNPSPHASLITEGARQLASHFYHSCAVIGNEVQCWGDNADAQLGRGTSSVSKIPVTVRGITASLVAAGSSHVCAIASDGVYCWGENQYGQAGVPGFKRIYEPTRVATTLSNVNGVTAAYQQTCVGGNGLAECWGKAWTGRLGTGADVRSQQPSAMLDTGIDDLALGADHVCALLANDTIRCYGGNGSKQLGVATGASYPNGVTVATGAIGAIEQIVAGRKHTCVRASSGVYCWGENGLGQLGNGDTTGTDRHDLQSVSGIGTVIQIAAGEDHSCALNAAGTVYCWGRNLSGQLGTGTRTTAYSPVTPALPAGPTVVAVAAGSSGRATCVKRSDGTVLCWGRGDEGQLGNDTAADSTMPSLVTGFSGAISIAFGYRGTCAVITGGEVRCTGESRMLGDGDRSLSVPMPVDLGLGACTQ